MSAPWQDAGRKRKKKRDSSQGDSESKRTGRLHFLADDMAEEALTRGGPTPQEWDGLSVAMTSQEGLEAGLAAAGSTINDQDSVRGTTLVARERPHERSQSHDEEGCDQDEDEW